MLKLNRDSVLKSFMEKVNEAKRLNMKDVKLTLKEIDDLFQVVYELMTEQISNALVNLEVMKESEITKKQKQNKKRRVIEKIEFENDIGKNTEDDEEKDEKISKPISKPIYEMVINEKPKSQPIKVNTVIEDPDEEDNEEDDEDSNENSLYGGTW